MRDVHNTDVAFLSMDGFRTLNDKEAIKAIREIRPKIVVPIHYKWHDNGEKIVEKVKGIVEHEEVSILFKKMKYSEAIEV